MTGRREHLGAPTIPSPHVARRILVQEVWLVCALSLGASAVYALLDLLEDLSLHRPLSAQSAVLNPSVPGPGILDLAFQLAGIAIALLPVLLVLHLLSRSGEHLSDLGASRRMLGRDVLWGSLLAATVGGVGLALYLGAYHAGLSLRVVPTTIGPAWWRVPVLLLSAAQNGILEEVVVCAYLLRRLQQLGWGPGAALLVSALLRGSYHLYQGFGGFGGNVLMGLLFGVLYLRSRRLVPLVTAHTLIDAGAFVGYVLLHGHVSWLP